MNQTRSPFRIWAPRVAVVGVVGLSLTSLYAFKAIFPHSGEQAWDLVPNSALAVATLDLDPSPSQALVFKKIDDALARNGIGDSIESLTKKAMEGLPEQKALWALTKKNATVCLLSSPDKKDDMDGAALIQLSDGSQADQILKSKGRSEFWKGTHYYRLPHSPFGAMVEGDTLVIANTPWVFHEMAKVPQGQLQPITRSADFAEARAKEPSDASLIVMVSPKLVSDHKEFGHVPSGWITASLTLQDGGLAFSVHGKDDPASNEATAMLSSIKPLRSDLTHVLPSGAYGVFAISQPASYLAATEKNLQTSQYSKDISKGESDFEKQTSVDIHNDVLPAFKGDAVLAAYPSEENVAGVDLLLVVDNRNGANPDALADKFQAFVDKAAKEKDGPGKDWAIQVPRTDAVEYRLGPKVEKDLRGTVKPDHSNPVNTDVLMGHKTVAWAKVDGAVMLASSQEMLDRAISNYQGKSASLSNDAPMAAAADGESQSLAILNFATIAKGVENTIDSSKISAENRQQFKQVLSLFESLSTPLSVKGSIKTDGTTSGTIFVPMDYDKIVDLIGSVMNKGDKRAALR